MTLSRPQASWLVLLATGLLWAAILAPAWALGGFGPNGGSSSSGGSSYTLPGANAVIVVNGAGTNFAGVAEVDGACLLGAGGVWTAGSCGGSGGGIPSIAGTVNQITETGSPGATTLSLSSTLVLPGTINGNTIPSASDTVVLLAATQTLTGKSIVATQLTGTLQAAQFPILTGDITTAGGALATTLATVNANTGAWGDSTHVGQIILNGKGLATAASSVAIAFPVTSVFGRTGAVVSAANDYNFNQLAGSVAASQMPAFTGDASSSAGATVLTLVTVNGSVGTFGDATHCNTETVNGKGLDTAISTNLCTPAFSSVTGSIALSQFPTLAADSFWLNATGSAAVPTAVAFPSCSTGSSALTYNTTSHALGCNSISGGSLSYTATFSGAVSGTPSAVGLGLDLAAANFTDNNTAGAGTAALFAAHSIEVPVLLATNTTVTTTHAATLYIAGAPTASTNETISAKDAVFIANGDLNMGTAGQKFQMFNVGSPGATNTEAWNCAFVANIYTCGATKTGTGVLRAYAIDLTTTGNGMAFKVGSGNSISFVVNGTTQLNVNSSGLASNAASGSQIMGNLNASATVPTLIPNRAATTTGVGAQASGNISLTVAGVEVNRVTGTAFTQIAGQTVLKSYTVATLPTGITGGQVVVTDAVACTFAAAVTGGGTTFCPVYYNGTAWQAY